MELYLMQHGSSLPAELDPERPLSPVGHDCVVKSAQAMRRMGLDFDAILVSSRTRSRQTGAIVAKTLRLPETRIHELEAISANAPAEHTLDVLRTFADREAVLVVGHLPNLANLAALLVTPCGALSLRFDNACLTRIDLEDPEPARGQLCWHLTPFQLQMVAG